MKAIHSVIEVMSIQQLVLKYAAGSIVVSVCLDVVPQKNCLLVGRFSALALVVYSVAHLMFHCL